MKKRNNNPRRQLQQYVGETVAAIAGGLLTFWLVKTIYEAIVNYQLSIIN